MVERNYMGIEAIGVAVGSVASAVGRGAVSVGRISGEAPLAGAASISNFGSSFVAEGPVSSLAGFKPMGIGDIGVPDVGGVVGSPDKLGSSVPVGISFLEGFRPMDINNINPDPGGVFRPGEIIFKTGPELKTTSPTIYLYDRTPKWYTSHPLPLHELVRSSISTLGNAVVYPALEYATQQEKAPGSFRKTEREVSARTASVISVKPVPKEQLEEVVEEKVLVEKDQQEEVGSRNNEDVSEAKVKIVEASEISERRKQEIKIAVQRLKGKGIIGKLLKSVLSAEFWKAKSPIVGQGKDWTTDLTVGDIESDTTEYSTLEEAEKAWVSAVEKNIPVKKGQAGRTATVEEVNKVVHGRKDWLAPKTPAEMVIKRVVKKSMELIKSGKVKVLEDKTDTKVEGSLKDLNLEEVFQKAV